MRSAKGFTLVEIAIVLVIIGLLLGGVLKGQELIENGKVKAAVNDFNGISAAFYAYMDRYKQLPGDDAQATTRWAAATNGTGVRSLAALAVGNTFTGAGENQFFFQDLRYAQLLNGDPTQTLLNALPTNSFGGIEGVATGTTYGIGAVGVVCMQNVPGDSALALDLQMDDGNPATGNVRGVGVAAIPSPAPTVAAPAAGNYIEADYYTICRSL